MTAKYKSAQIDYVNQNGKISWADITGNIMQKDGKKYLYVRPTFVNGNECRQYSNWIVDLDTGIMYAQKTDTFGFAIDKKLGRRIGYAIGFVPNRYNRKHWDDRDYTRMWKQNRTKSKKAA